MQELKALIPTIKDFSLFIRDKENSDLFSFDLPFNNLDSEDFDASLTNYTNLNQWNIYQEQIVKLLKTAEAYKVLGSKSTKYTIPENELTSYKFTERELALIEQDIETNGRFRSEIDFKRRLRDNVGISPKKIDIASLWATYSSPAFFVSKEPVERLNREELAKFIYKYHANQLIQGKSKFTQQELEKDFLDVIESFGQIKSLETEQYKALKSIQEIAIKYTQLNPENQNDLVKIREIQDKAKVYYKQLKRYEPDGSRDPAIANLEKLIEQTNEKINKEKSSKETRIKYLEKLNEKLRSYEKELDKLLDIKRAEQEYPGINQKNRDLSFDRFIREEQNRILDLTISYQNGLINQSVWKREIESIFRSEIYIYKIIQNGGLNNLDVEELDVLARNLKKEIRKFYAFTDFIQSSPQKQFEIIGYALSIPIKIILDDIKLNLLSQMPNKTLATVLNSQFREVSKDLLASLQSKNKNFFNLITSLPADLALKYTSSSVTNWLQEQVNSYIFSKEFSAQKLRAADDWLRYSWDPAISRYVSRNPIGVSYRSLIFLYMKDRNQFIYRVFGKKGISFLTPEEKLQLEQIDKLVEQFNKANFYRQYQLAAETRKKFEAVLTEDQKKRINPGINRIDPKTGKKFFIGRFIRSNQILSDEDTLALNRLLLLERKEALELLGKYGFASQAQSLADWEFDVAKTLKKYHILSYALGSGLNPTQFKQRDYNKLTNILTVQYTYLRDLVFDMINNNSMSESRFLNRLLQYASSTAISYFAGKVESYIRGGWKRARRQLTSGESCEGCKSEAARGWISIDYFVPIGSIGPCYSNCQCTVEFTNDEF